MRGAAREMVRASSIRHTVTCAALAVLDGDFVVHVVLDDVGVFAYDDHIFVANREAHEVKAVAR